MSITTRWWWVRHAPVPPGGLVYGNQDVAADCSEPGPFRHLAALLPDQALWVTSHLQRTHQTAKAILDQRGKAAPDTGALEPANGVVAHLVEPMLAEQDFGDWQGFTHAELEQSRGQAMGPFWLSPAQEVPPGGESFVQVIERVSGAIQRLTSQYRGRDIVAVAHGGTIRAALSLALALDPERALAFSVDNCSLTRIDHISFDGQENAPEDAWRVSQVNLPTGNLG